MRNKNASSRNHAAPVRSNRASGRNNPAPAPQVVTGRATQRSRGTEPAAE